MATAGADRNGGSGEERRLTQTGEKGGRESSIGMGRAFLVGDKSVNIDYFMFF